MPKSKRNKQIELAKTKKRGLEWKKHLLEEVRSCVDSYTNVFVFSVNDMRNSKMKNVREQWKHSRFFIGKNKIMAMALGRFADEEYKPNLHKIGKQIKGQRALLFSNKSTEEVLSWFRSYSEGDYARSGNIATEDVKLNAGPLSQFPHSLEPYLRQLGLPTSLVKGVIHLVKDHEVCKAGDTLTPETAKILKLLGYEMAEFHITINCMWSQDGTFMQFTDDVEADTKENLKKKKKSISFKVEDKSPEIEKMEVEDEEDDDIPDLVEDKDDDIPDLVEHKDDDTSYTISKITIENLEEDGDDDNDDVSDSSEHKTKGTSYSIQKVVAKEIESDTSPSKLSKDKLFISTPKEKCNNVIQMGEVTEESFVVTSKIDLEDSIKKTPTNLKKGKVEKSSNDVNEEDTLDARESRPRKRKTKKAAAKNNSLLKTPDPNTSQDSPIFRELRNRSVKVNRKRTKK